MTRATAARAPFLVDTYRFMRHPRWELDIRGDLRDTTRAASFLRALPAPAPDAPVALVALYRDNVFDTKLGALLVTALRLRGFRAVVSAPTSRATRVQHYSRAFGIEDLVFMDHVRPSTAERAECREAAQRLLDRAPEFDVIKEWRFRGRQAGMHVLSTLIRRTFDGSPDLALSENRSLLEAIVADTLLNYVRAEHVLDSLSPRFLLVEEANYSVNGPLVDVAVERGIDVLQTIGIWRDDALMSKRLTRANRRVDAKSVAPETLATLREEPIPPELDRELDDDFASRYGRAWKLGRAFQPNTTGYSSEQIRDALSLDEDRRTAVIFAHVLWDASLFFGEDLFENYADWLVRSVGAAVENPRVNWLVKAHPSNVFRTAHGDVGAESSEVALLQKRFPRLPEHVQILKPDTPISTLSLYRFADYGVTVRGTPGMEMACFGKPVFTAGTGTYAGLGFTYDSTTVDDYLAKLGSIERYGRLPEEMQARARLYAHTLFTRRPWNMRSFALKFSFGARGWHPLDRNVVLTSDSISAIDDAGDLGVWATWALDTSDADYLERQRSNTSIH